MILNTNPNLEHHDEIYERLIDSYEGLDEEQSFRFSARLTITLINHIGDEVAIHEAFLLAQGRDHFSQHQVI
jgi:hypothetical protein